MVEKTILFVGDTALCADPFREQLKTAGGYDCIYASDIQKAQYKLYVEYDTYKNIKRPDRPALVVVDIYPLKFESGVFKKKRLSTSDFVLWAKKYYPQVLVMVMIMGQPQNSRPANQKIVNLEIQELKQKIPADHICQLPLNSVDLLKEIEHTFNNNVA